MFIWRISIIYQLFSLGGYQFPMKAIATINRYIIPLLLLMTVFFSAAALQAKESKSELWDEFSKSQEEKEVELSLPTEGDPHAGRQTWLTPAPQVQVQRDMQLRQFGKGSVFVPAMTLGIVEPKYQLLDEEGEVLQESYTGNSIQVAPGDYTVAVGSPVASDRMLFDVHVVDGEATVVPVEWSGLVVKVVNDRGTTIRGNYELITLPERGYVGLGSGALVTEGERMTTWILWPGQYMLISLGEGYQARKNFITVDLKPGFLKRITLVLDEENGNILGGGEIDNSYIDEAVERWWWAGVLVGGSVRFSRSDNVIGKANAQLLDISAFCDSFFNMNLKKNILYARFNAELGGTFRLNERPFLTTIDEFNVELLYAYRLLTWFGPYVRFSFESNMAPSYQEFSSLKNIRKYDGEGTLVSATDRLDLRLSPSFSPILLNMGGGARIDHSFGSWLKLSSRLGIAYRHIFTRDLYVLRSVDGDNESFELHPVNDKASFGVEAALNLELTPIKWFTLKVSASILEPFMDLKAPVIDVDLDAAFRISSIASISYSLRMKYDRLLIDKLQADQYIQLRFSYKIY